MALTMSLSAQNDDPHASGYWAVIIDKNNQEVWYKLETSDSDFLHTSGIVVADTSLADYDNWGDTHVNIPLFFVVDGKRYGGPEEMTEAYFWNPMENPLYENDNYYYIDSDRFYLLGIYTDPETQQYYCYVFWIDCYTDKPVISYKVTNDAVTVTATGDGEVRLFLVEDDYDSEDYSLQPVENPYSILRGDKDETYSFMALAKELCHFCSWDGRLDVTVPARDTTHDTGYWVVLIDKNGNEVWHQLKSDDNHDYYYTYVKLDFSTYGDFDQETGYRPDVCFNFSIDGVRYGAEEDLLQAAMGYAIDNPLFANDNHYTAPAGYSYLFGVCYDYEGNPYVYITQGSDVDEIGVDGKVVSSVRYYNIMGQEMREANGLTIIVTTYTDGSHSAVKVIK